MVEAIVGAVFQSMLHILMEKRACLSKVHDSMMPALSAPRAEEGLRSYIGSSRLVRVHKRPVDFLKFQNEFNFFGTCFGTVQ